MKKYGCLFFSSTMLAVVIASCITSKNEEQSQKLNQDEQKKLAVYQAEIDIGRNMAGRLFATMGVYRDRAANNYLNQVAGYVARYSDYAERRFMIGILDHEMVNAFACPGGYILVTRGLLQQIENEAELAAILGHEIAHVGRQHMFNALTKMSPEEMDNAGSGAADTQLTPNLQSRKRPKAERMEMGVDFTKYLGGANAGMSILKAAKAGMGLIMEKGLDKKLEFEADREGTKYAIRAGYQPTAMMEFLKRLEAFQQQKNADMVLLESTHPKTQERYEQVEATVRSMDSADVQGARGEKRLKTSLAKVKSTKKA